MHGPKIYKRSQGKYTRMTTALSVIIMGAWGCSALAEKLMGSGLEIYISYGVPVALLLIVGWGVFALVNRPRSADFLIATEGEMKKVSWSSRKEIIGSTKVVIVTTFLLAAILFLVDILFSKLFRIVGVMGS